MIDIVRDGMCEGCMEADFEVKKTLAEDKTGYVYTAQELNCVHMDACLRAYDKGYIDAQGGKA